MIVGRFADPFGRPFFQARVALPRLGLIGPVAFLFDTGADISLLTTDAASGLPLDVSRLERSSGAIGVGGGLTSTYAEPAMLGFDGADGQLYGFKLMLHIAEPQPMTASLPSLLGRDITDRWSIRYAPRLGLLEAAVLDADGVLPARSQGA